MCICKGYCPVQRCNIISQPRSHNFSRLHRVDFLHRVERLRPLRWSRGDLAVPCQKCYNPVLSLHFQLTCDLSRCKHIQWWRIQEHERAFCIQTCGAECSMATHSSRPHGWQAVRAIWGRLGFKEIAYCVRWDGEGASKHKEDPRLVFRLASLVLQTQTRVVGVG